MSSGFFNPQISSWPQGSAARSWTFGIKPAAVKSTLAPTKMHGHDFWGNRLRNAMLDLYVNDARTAGQVHLCRRQSAHRYDPLNCGSVSHAPQSPPGGGLPTLQFPDS